MQLRLELRYMERDGRKLKLNFHTNIQSARAATALSLKDLGKDLELP